MEEESTLERISGNLPLNLAATAFAAISGNLLTALLPSLAASPAAARHKKRIEEAFAELN